MSETSDFGPGSKRERPTTAGDNTDLVEVILLPYFEGVTFYVNWEVKPRDPAHAILRTQVLVEADGARPEDYNIIAEIVGADGGGEVPAGLMLRGESPHRSIVRGTSVRITIFGWVQVSPGNREGYSLCRVVVAGRDELTPCEE